MNTERGPYFWKWSIMFSLLNQANNFYTAPKSQPVVNDTTFAEYLLNKTTYCVGFYFFQMHKYGLKDAFKIIKEV